MDQAPRSIRRPACGPLQPPLSVDATQLSEACAPLLSRSSFPRGPLELGVSGGADSLALLALAVEHAGPAQVIAIHVDHGLRTGSSTESERVQRCATELGAAFRAVTVHVGAGSNLEARARAARYAALPPTVCTGHTADDLAETMLANLVRGAGVDGWASLARRRPGPVRPLLNLRRADTERLCAVLGWQPLMDPMNIDPAFTRVRMRTEVLPLLADVARRDVVAVLARQAWLAADEADLLDRLASDVDPTDARALSVAPIALARRALRAWLTQEGVGDGHPLDAACVERALQVATGVAPRCDLVAGWMLSRTAQRLHLTQSADVPT